MLTFLFALAAIWTLFWLAMLLLDWNDTASSANKKLLCAHCASKLSNRSANATANINANTNTDINANTNANTNVYTNANANANATNIGISDDDAIAKQAAAVAARDSIQKTPVADEHDQASVTPLFDAPDEADDLKYIKGIGVVMEKTLNGLGITTFKQLAAFQQAEIKMVSAVLTESKTGFGDRIERDEWVDQAKVLANKAS